MKNLSAILFLSLFLLPGQVRCTENLASGKSCKVFSFADSTDLSFKKLTDGQTGILAWSSKAFATYADHSLFPEYVVIDLGKTCLISKVVLHPRGDNEMAGKGFPEDFSVQVCREGDPWNTVIQKKGYPELSDGSAQSFSISGIHGRFIKVEATRLRTAEPGKYRFQLSEIEVFGKELPVASSRPERIRPVKRNGITSVTRLLCENRENPIGIDTDKPRFSWWLENKSDRGLRQVAYRILVASSPENLARDLGDLWDSGKVPGDQSVAINYKGKKTTTGQTCYWKSRVWYTDSRGPAEHQTAWSTVASWTNGKMGETDWKGNWIGANDDTGHGAVYLRKEIDVAKPVRRAMIYFSGLGYSECHINGKKVGEYLIVPGFTNYDKRVQYLTYDVTADFAGMGRKVLGVVLVDGWYGIEKDPWVHKFETNVYVDRPKLLLNLHLEYADGTELVVASGPDWKWSLGEIVKSGIEYEDIDKRKSLKEWDKPGYNAAGWREVKVVDPPSRETGQPQGTAMPDR
jgi:hypothetical protein